ncbi:hypothetical protein [Streptosporangium subroseum]|uniref:hypothetical protein n=1 Tax=Streptosporangium subroseum TaxID=106412 RepID=UPI0015C6449B|nr:hypothetical protein [Streptosporangium subroseum]
MIGEIGSIMCGEGRHAEDPANGIPARATDYPQPGDPATMAKPFTVRITIRDYASDSQGHLHEESPGTVHGHWISSMAPL